MEKGSKAFPNSFTLQWKDDCIYLGLSHLDAILHYEMCVYFMNLIVVRAAAALIRSDLYVANVHRCEQQEGGKFLI